jgi:choline-glycine betaine transporter
MDEIHSILYAVLHNGQEGIAGDMVDILYVIWTSYGRRS